MSEATLAAVAQIGERFHERIPEGSWSMRFGDRQWEAHFEAKINGRRSELTLIGYTYGNDGETLSDRYVGLGTAGGEPLVVKGETEWLYDKTASDYRDADFRQLTEIGRDPFWGWVLGAEIIGGGAAGAVVTLGTAAFATGGLALGAAPFIAAQGAMNGSAALVAISAAAQSLLHADATPPPPAAPKRPSLPANGEKVSPSEGTVVVALLPGEKILGSAMDGIHVLNGHYIPEKGFAEGSIHALKK